MKRGGPEGWPDGWPDDAGPDDAGTATTVRKWDGSRSEYREVRCIRVKSDGPGVVIETTEEIPQPRNTQANER